jgi:hypothetical protein
MSRAGANLTGFRSVPLSPKHRETLGRLLAIQPIGKLCVMLGSGKETVLNAQGGHQLMPWTKTRLESAIDRVALRLAPALKRDAEPGRAAGVGI